MRVRRGQISLKVHQFWQVTKSATWCPNLKNKSEPDWEVEQLCFLDHQILSNQ